MIPRKIGYAIAHHLHSNSGITWERPKRCEREHLPRGINRVITSQHSTESAYRHRYRTLTDRGAIDWLIKCQYDRAAHRHRASSADRGDTCYEGEIEGELYSIAVHAILLDI